MKNIIVTVFFLISVIGTFITIFSLSSSNAQVVEGEIIISKDDKVSPKNSINFAIQTPSITTVEYSIDNITEEIMSIDNQIAFLQKRKTELEIIKTKIEIEVTKLPPRVEKVK